MFNWHKTNCRHPDVAAAGEVPYCSACDSLSSDINVLNGDPPILLQPMANPRSTMDLRWPSSVKYLDPDGADNTLELLKFVESPQTDVDSSKDERPRTTRAAQMGTEGDEDMSMGYGCLSGDKFRLLKVFKGVIDEPIHCEFIETHVNKYPRYEALSYTWADLNGDKQRCKAVYLASNWSIILITANCHAALQAMRSQEQDIIIWVDAICINQDNPRERTQQVGLMRRIYENAWRVIIFLGGDLREFLKYTQITASWSNILRHPYFKRVWVIQEIASASTANIVYFSSHLKESKIVRFDVDWTTFCDDLDSNDSLFVPKSHPWIFRFCRPGPLERGGLINLLIDSLSSASSDPRDRVFALLGLIRDAKRDGLEADYSLSTQHVYTGLAAYAITVLRDMRVLKYAGWFAVKDPTLPSWVPNWEGNTGLLSGSARYTPLSTVTHQDINQPLVYRQTGALEIDARELGELQTLSRQSRIKLFHTAASHNSYIIETRDELCRDVRVFVLRGLDCPIILMPLSSSSLAFRLVGHGKLIVPEDNYEPFPESSDQRDVITWWAAIKDPSNLPESICQIWNDGLRNTLLDTTFVQDLQHHCDSTRKLFDHEVNHWNKRLKLNAQLLCYCKPAGSFWSPMSMSLPVSEWQSSMMSLQYVAHNHGLDPPDRDQRQITPKMWFNETMVLIQTQSDFEDHIDKYFSDRPISATSTKWHLPPWISRHISETELSYSQAHLSQWRSSLRQLEEKREKWKTVLGPECHEISVSEYSLWPVEGIIEDEVSLIREIFKRWAIIMKTVELSERIMKDYMKRENIPEEAVLPVPDDDDWHKIVII